MVHISVLECRVGRDIINIVHMYVVWCLVVGTLVCPGLDQCSLCRTCYLGLSPAQATRLVTLQGYHQSVQSLVGDIYQHNLITFGLRIFKYFSQQKF